MKSLHLPFTIYHLPLIFHLSFNKEFSTSGVNCELIIANLLKIENCKLKIASAGGGLG